MNIIDHGFDFFLNSYNIIDVFFLVKIVFIFNNEQVFYFYIRKKRVEREKSKQKRKNNFYFILFLDAPSDFSLSNLYCTPASYDENFNNEGTKFHYIYVRTTMQGGIAYRVHEFPHTDL
jgi:hypothetical protein